MQQVSAPTKKQDILEITRKYDHHSLVVSLYEYHFNVGCQLINLHKPNILLILVTLQLQHAKLCNQAWKVKEKLPACYHTHQRPCNLT